MTAERALEILKHAAKMLASYEQFDGIPEVRSALAFFEGKHVYVSRYAPDETVFLVVEPRRRGLSWWISVQPWRWWMLDPKHPDADLIFPTREEAQAECDRRNKEAK